MLQIRWFAAIRLGVISWTVASVATVAAAQDPSPLDMRGTWVAVEGEYSYWDGQTTNIQDDYHELSLVVTRQNGATFFVDQVVKTRREDHPARHGTEPITSSTTPMLGVVSFDNTRVVIADIGDTTTLQCTITTEDTLDCLTWEAGDHALAGRKRLKRDPR